MQRYAASAVGQAYSYIDKVEEGGSKHICVNETV